MPISSRKCSADFRAFSADFRTFPADFRAFLADFRAFAVSAFWLRKLQTRKSGKEAVTHCPTAIGDERPETELSMTGRVNCKLCSCASKCTTNAHSLLTAISVKFPQKCTLTLFSACTEISVLLEGSGIYIYIYILPCRHGVSVAEA